MRTSGCNFTCSGWGVKTTLPDGTEVTGCDSPHSVFPQIYRQPGQSTMLEPAELLSRIPEYPKNVCLTGGEPLLQWKRIRPTITDLLSRGQDVEVFTNGSIAAPYHHYNVFPNNEGVITYVMDHKLESSGEGGKFHRQNFWLLGRDDSIKFVIGTHDDFLEAWETIKEFEGPFTGTWLMGVVWQKLEPTELIEWILRHKLNVRLNLQTQSMMNMDELERTAFAKHA